MAGSTRVIVTTWRDLVIRADPDHVRDSRINIEYQFTSVSGRGRPETHEGGFRVFRGDYKRRGPYKPSTE